MMMLFVKLLKKKYVFEEYNSPLRYLTHIYAYTNNKISIQEQMNEVEYDPPYPILSTGEVIRDIY